MLPNSPPGPPYPPIPPRPSEIEQVADMLAFQDRMRGDQRPKRFYRLFTYAYNQALGSSIDFTTDMPPDYWVVKWELGQEAQDMTITGTFTQSGMMSDLVFMLTSYLGAGPAGSTGDRDRFVIPGTSNKLHVSWPQGPPNGVLRFTVAAIIGYDPGCIL